MSGSGELSVKDDDSLEKFNSHENEEVIHELIHYQQKYHWDCGLSCILMILPYKERNCMLNNMNTILSEEGFGESTWTIDLAYLLQRFDMVFRYTTTTLGVDPGYVEENFYDKVLAKDSGRVNTRFTEASSRGITVEKVSESLANLLDHLLTRGPIIVLTNANLLTCTTCRSNISSYVSSFFSSRSHYQGHYVVLVGFNSKTSEVLYRNPTLKDKVCSMPYKQLEEARTSYGTDEDVIFVTSYETK